MRPLKNAYIYPSTYKDHLHLYPDPHNEQATPQFKYLSAYRLPGSRTLDES